MLTEEELDRKVAEIRAQTRLIQDIIEGILLFIALCGLMFDKVNFAIVFMLGAIFVEVIRIRTSMGKND